MLVFLDIASQQQYVVDKYIDNPIGFMKKDAIGKLSITRVTLRAQVTFSGEKQPSVDEIEKLHHQSHELCFIANSVKTEVVTEIIP
jgi:organic hydroperoxide reductase OsmC/OhrA